MKMDPVMSTLLQPVGGPDDEQMAGGRRILLARLAQERLRPSRQRRFFLRPAGILAGGLAFGALAVGGRLPAALAWTAPSVTFSRSYQFQALFRSRSSTCRGASCPRTFPRQPRHLRRASRAPASCCLYRPSRVRAALTVRPSRPRLPTP
jgi:hypothetical protein